MKKIGQLTQLVECHLDVVKVTGSSPVLPTIKKSLLIKRFFFFLVMISVLSLILLYKHTSYLKHLFGIWF